MLLFASTIFTSALLLFLVQPVVAKQILPWFGGSAAVWTTCLVFFQTALLAGYAYCDFVVRRLGPRTQVKLHLALLAVSLAFLPIVPDARWKPASSDNPSSLILVLLVATIGVPYFLLSTTSPLVQAWFARARPDASPYRLFALSNLGSMLALVGYPALLEPWAPTRAQAVGWSMGYAVFVVLCAAAGWTSLRGSMRAAIGAPSVREAPDVHEEGAGRPPTFGRQFLWCALAATGSLLLLAVSNHITQNIASVPLLWIVPLALYLLTFILCFDRRDRYPRGIARMLLAVGLCAMAWTLADPDLTHELTLQLGVFCVGLFVACMFCHGELARLKPHPKYLTRFYLMVSVGGAAGSVLIGVIAPLALPAYFELAGGLVICAALLWWQSWRGTRASVLLAAATCLFTLGCGVWGIVDFYDSTIVGVRNFYGVLRVQNFGQGKDNHRSLVHGTILHGTQYTVPELRQLATTYYGATSGIGRLLELLHARGDPLRVGVVGLGTGTLAAYGSAGDVFRFYDINPAVIDLARRNFTYLADSEATVETALGDARLSLEREPPQGFNVLVIDAFSSDAIPIHLMTSEAFTIYKRHLAADGILAFHVTNRFLDLIPVVERLSTANGMRIIHIADEGERVGTKRSDWLLLSENGALLAEPRLAGFATPIEPRPHWRLWTDDFSNLVQVLK